MKCNWCNGTYEECGCGFGHCVHCLNGQVTEPPFGPLDYCRNCDDLNILSNDDFNTIIDETKRDIYQQFAYVPEHLGFPSTLTDNELALFNSYWDSPHRNETLGDVLNRVAWLVKEKSSNLNSVA